MNIQIVREGRMLLEWADELLSKMLLADWMGKRSVYSLDCYD